MTEQALLAIGTIAALLALVLYVAWATGKGGVR